MPHRNKIEEYRNSPAEIARTKDLLDIVPKNLSTVLDVGARDGHFSQLLTQYFESVTALDLTMPQFQFDRVLPVQGDVTNLQFPDKHFDVVFCAEVLEHVPALEKACSEISRIARHAIVIGVPYRQDIRVGRTTCNHCGKTNPPWGHVNTFDEHKVSRLFPGYGAIATSFVGSTNEGTNFLSVWLMDLAGNPWGVYDQDEPCIHCGKHMSPPCFPAFREEVDCSRGAEVEPVAIAVQSHTSELDPYGLPESLNITVPPFVSSTSSQARRTPNQDHIAAIVDVYLW